MTRNNKALPAGSAQPNMEEARLLLLRLPGGNHPHHLNFRLQLVHAATNLQHAALKPHLSAQPPERARAVHVTSMNQETFLKELHSFCCYC